MSLSEILLKYIRDAEDTYRDLPHEEFKALAKETVETMIREAEAEAEDDERSPKESENMRERAARCIDQSESDVKRMRERDSYVREACVEHIVAFIDALRRPYIDGDELRNSVRGIGDFF